MVTVALAPPLMTPRSQFTTVVQEPWLVTTDTEMTPGDVSRESATVTPVEVAALSFVTTTV